MRPGHVVRYNGVMKITAQQKAAFEALRHHALSLPSTNEEFPWGHSAIKVKGKTFIFLHSGEMEGAVDAVSLSVKLPLSAGHALHLPFASPTGYGLGKANWVSFRFSGTDDVATDLLLPWIVESYRAVAPKTQLKLLDAGASTPPAKKPAMKKAVTKKPAAKKTPAKKPAAKKTPAKKTAKKKASSSSR